MTPLNKIVFPNKQMSATSIIVIYDSPIAPKKNPKKGVKKENTIWERRNDSGDINSTETKKAYMNQIRTTAWVASNSPTAFRNDAGQELAALNAYQATAESDCKKSHESAYLFRGAGPAGKPYRDCVSSKMEQYDARIGAEQDAKRKAAEDARIAQLEKERIALEAKHTANLQEQSDSLSKVEAAKTSSIQADDSATIHKYMAIGGVLLVFILVVLLYKKLTLTTSPLQTA